ncbi:hypothetical protein CLV41_108216 [Roseibium marinum]|uniref:Uncharacterized protein n=1 Tax=Roseibium marinum TaxID=281252 RepID=A0A2S3UQ08_9HYPH|nr:hypothetical protein CLV41_108216 [Roseibium marinum]
MVTARQMFAAEIRLPLHTVCFSAICALAPAPLEEAFLDRSRTSEVFARPHGGSPVRYHTLKEFCHGCQL